MNLWIGVDLDGTLAKWEDGQDINTIGDPVPSMVDRIQKWNSSGKCVKIMTARVSPIQPNGCSPTFVKQQYDLITQWCLKHLKLKLQITHEKDYGMVELWDDRVVPVEHNTGRPLLSEI